MFFIVKTTSDCLERIVILTYYVILSKEKFMEIYSFFCSPKKTNQKKAPVIFAFGFPSRSPGTRGLPNSPYRLKHPRALSLSRTIPPAKSKGWREKVSPQAI
jgi:hypothetical protein